MLRPFDATDPIYIGEDRALVVRVLGPETVELTTPGVTGATALNVRPLPYALADTAKLRFGTNTIITLTAAAAAGAAVLAVSALPGPLAIGERGRKIVNVTGYALEFEVLAVAGAGVPLITKTTGAGIVLTTATEGLVTISIDDTDTIGLDPGVYFCVLRRTTAGSERVLYAADFHLARAGE